MKNGNHAKGLNKKSIALVAAVALVLVGAIGGTIAWLLDTSDPVTNTFKPTTLSVELKESVATDGKKEYTMVPGTNEAKDPVVTVTNDVDAYVFVRIDEPDFIVTADGVKYTFADFVDWDVADGWTELEDGVYYRTVTVDAADKEFEVLACVEDPTDADCTGCVTFKADVTKEMMDALIAMLDTDGNGEISAKEAEAYPALTFEAYIIQKDNIADADNTADGNVDDAWELVK